jgi:hypothetical protein
VEKGLIREALKSMKVERVLPFRFITAARHAPDLEPELEGAMFKCLEGAAKLAGHTVLLVDVSGSMEAKLSGKSELLRMDAAFGLAMLLREICEEVTIYSFSEQLVKIPPRRGFALRDAIKGSQPHGGTPLGLAIRCIYADMTFVSLEANMATWLGTHVTHPVAGYKGQGLRPDRLIAITDEQAADKVPDPAHGKGYMLNVASAQNGVGYGAWTHIDGFSEAVVTYIQELERAQRSGELV